MRIGWSQNLNSSALERTSRAIARSLERLSSGKRINSPRDDAAGFNLNQSLSSQVRGISQGLSNIDEARALIQTADTAVQSQIDVVRRMREIALTASSENLDSAERANLKTELQQLVDQFRRLSADAKYNDQNLLDGSFTNKKFLLDGNSLNALGMNIGGTRDLDVFTNKFGTGAFESRKTLMPANVGGGALSLMQAADFNNDGAMDLAGYFSSTSHISVMLNDGSGNFSLPLTTDSSAGSLGDLQVGDIDNDGNEDLVGLDGGGYTHYFLGNGDGSFQAGVTLDTSGVVPGYLRLGDTDADGDLEVIVTDYINIFQSTWTGSGFSAVAPMDPVGNYGINDFALADFNGDQVNDFIAVDTNGGDTWVHVYLGEGDGTFGAVTTFAAGQNTIELEIGDFNRDGKQDVLVRNDWDSNVTTLLGDGAGGLAAGGTFSYGVGANKITTGDYDGDGILDLFILSSASSTTIARGNGNGGFSSLSNFRFSGVLDIVATDFDGDGVLDVVSGNGSANSRFQFFKGKSISKADLSALDISTEAKAQVLVEVLDNALTALESRSAELTALHSRLDQASAHQILLHETLDEARAQNEDVDFALETAEAVRLQILQQAQTAVRAQSTVSMAMVLKLLEPLG